LAFHSIFISYNFSLHTGYSEWIDRNDYNVG
jgi:hypothetical protein